MSELGPLQTEFIRALREDNIPQGRFAFFRIIPGKEVCEHCALGVAIMTCASNGLDLRWTKVNSKWTLNDNQGLKVAEMLKFTEAGSHQIIVLNDINMLTFPQIADEIEKNPLFYFTEPA
jgi:hypothetical protein